ncbi:hypothetical protein, partial [Microbacterium sp. 18062]|uniref:hypothetical protein n=1 Tax=Microbacterium sp. 18062 TaxID=2681410 RepID=UPI001F3F671C
DVIDAHPGDQGARALEPQTGGTRPAQDGIAQVPDLRLSAEVGDILRPDGELPERRDGLTPGRGLKQTRPVPAHLQD